MEGRNRLTAVILIKAAALVTCVAPALVATLSYFPVWATKGELYVMSGLALCLITLSLLPFYKHLSALLKSPASYVIWLILFIVFFLLSKIAHEMTVISFVGFISNLIGAALFGLAKRCERRGGEDE